MIKSLLLTCLLSFVLAMVVGQVEFPENLKIDKKKSNLAGRLPLYSPTRCRLHELLYPGDQADDWICDCAPAALYHPDTDACYPAFRQGPCPNEQFLVLGRNEIIPECIANDCKIDGQVKINNACYVFGRGPPCKNSHLSYVLGVDPEMLQVDCVAQSVQLLTRLGEIGVETTTPPAYNTENILQCARGSKRMMNRQCPSAQ